MHLSPARRSPLDSARQKKRAASPLRFLPPHRLRSFYGLAQFFAVKGSLSDHLCVATCRFFTFPSSICPNKLHRQRCVFFSSRLFLPRFRIRQPLDYRRGRIEGHPPMPLPSFVYRRSDSLRYSERRARHFFTLPSVSTKAAFFHAAQSSDRSPQRHPPPTRPEPAGRSELLWQTPVRIRELNCPPLVILCTEYYKRCLIYTPLCPVLVYHFRKALIYATSQHCERGFICTS